MEEGRAIVGKGMSVTYGSTQQLPNNMAISDSQTSLDVGNGHLTKKEPHQAVEVHVERLTYRVPRQQVTWWQYWLATHSLLPTSCVDGTRVVLDDVTFTVKSGQMLAILGSSGEVTGEVLLNGVPRTQTMLSACAAYVRQDDRLMATLTVRETLMFVAQLKLPRTFSTEEITARVSSLVLVDSVIAELGLVDAADTRVGSAEIRGVSGGERRRVSIGLLFLDEPTSGLDSFTASHLVTTLSDLAKNRRTILMSIHQPRSNIFELFDLVLLLSGGRMVYFGEARHMTYGTRYEPAEPSNAGRTALAMSMMLGVVYWQLEPTQGSLRDHFGVLYMISVMYPYLIIVDIIETCFKERKLLYFETQDHLYSIESYYLAKVFLIVFLSVLCSRGLAMLSAALMPTFQASCFFAQTIFSLFIMSAGFFINLDNILTAITAPTLTSDSVLC
nr:hypothetical protein BaRGS_018707 [Batillaria attramentaria]